MGNLGGRRQDRCRHLPADAGVLAETRDGFEARIEDTARELALVADATGAHDTKLLELAHPATPRRAVSRCRSRAALTQE
jgi:hypothetical protein